MKHLMFLLVLLAGSTTFACADFSGAYQHETEAGVTKSTVTQDGCKSLTVATPYEGGSFEEKFIFNGEEQVSSVPEFDIVSYEKHSIEGKTFRSTGHQISNGHKSGISRTFTLLENGDISYTQTVAEVTQQGLFKKIK